MALTPNEIKNRFPLPAFNFKVEINGEFVAFSEVTGLNRSYETITYKESKTTQPGSGPEIMYMPAQVRQVRLSLKKGYVLTKNLPVFYNWINSIRINQVEKKDIKVRLTDEEGNAVVTWTIINALPIELHAPEFIASSNSVAIEQMDLVADLVVMEEN